MCSTPRNSGHLGGISKLKDKSADYSSHSEMLKRASERFEQRQQERRKRQEK